MVYHRIIVHDLSGDVYYVARTGVGFMFTQMTLYGINLSRQYSDKITGHLAKNYILFEESLVLDTSIGNDPWF